MLNFPGTIHVLPASFQEFSVSETVAYRPVPGYPGYLVGDDGSVWSRWKRGPSSRMGSEYNRRLNPVVWSPYGHLAVYLSRNGKRRGFSLGALVLLAFVGPAPEGMECRHSPDRSPADCNLSNLCWGTRQENVRDCVRDGNLYAATLTGEKNINAKLTETDVREIRAASGLGCVRRMGQKFGVSRTTVISIRMRRTWRHVV